MPLRWKLVEIEEGNRGLCHVSELSGQSGRETRNAVKVGGSSFKILKSTIAEKTRDSRPRRRQG